MRIIPRSESGLAPPRGNPTGPYEKNVIIIHYTCSPNGILAPEREKGLMQMWQNDHEAKYKAWDVLQAYSLFQSGRIYENRLWTANSGAIYNSAGGITFGWSSKGVGIENQGDFRKDEKGNPIYMSDLQYMSLVYLCANIYQRAKFKPLAGRFIFGHKELPPCRPQDPWEKGTDCPANLLNQFVANGKLQNDVLASLKGTPVGAKQKEDEMALYEGDGKKFVFEDCYTAKYNYFLHTRGKADEITFTLTAHETGIPLTSESQSLNGHKVHNLQDVAAYPRTLTKGSYVLECEASSAIHWALREVPK
jgi:hypothetical protein